MCSVSASEASLNECIIFDACTSTCNSSTVGIRCYGNGCLHVVIKGLVNELLFLFHCCSIAEPSECPEGAVRLAGGDISQEGRPEVCIDAVWGSVCGDGWDQTDAHTLCQQLELGEGGQNNSL